MIKKLLIPAVLAIALIVGAVGVSGVLAQTPTPTPSDHQTALLSKVATILGIDQQRVTSAFNQAARELHNERIDQAVAEGRITQEYANWLKQRPESAVGGPGIGRGLHGPMGGRFAGGPR